MKRKLGLLPAVGIIFALSLSAFTSGAFQSEDPALATYTWVRLSDNMTTTGTQSSAQTTLGCPKLTGTPCAEAYEEGHPNEENHRVPTQDIFKD
ncbi:hypothetical protein GCM10023091_36690 [Ravibacter arvi]|uniref:Secreted protein n=1 Tax=Ravibacter arvi TaxID=2051041 RepID=A0ABP8M8H3_9BACT